VGFTKKTLVIALAATGLNADVSADASAANANALDSIVVIGRGEARADAVVIGSVDTITRDELADEHVDDTMEVFTKIPGVYISRYNQGLINTDIAIRGFAGDGETPHAKLLIDGVPSNLHSGYSELDQLFPMLMDSVQVFKGTSDPRVGRLNIAGNYRVGTRTDAAREIQLNLGSYQARELQGYFGVEGDALTQNYFAGWRDAEGYRDGNDLNKRVAHARWAYNFTDATTIAATVRYSKYDADAPGYLSQAASRATPRARAAFAALDGGDKTVKGAHAALTHQFSDALSIEAIVYQQLYERERWVRFTEAASLQNRFDDQDHVGIIGTLNWQLNDQFDASFGVDTDQQDVLEQRFGTVGFTRVRNSANVLRNRDFKVDTDGGFVNLGFSQDRFSIDIGVRLDRFDGDYVQFSASGAPQARSILDFGTIVQPKANAIFQLSDALSIFANAGRSFQNPLSADLFTTGDRSARDVSINNGFEFGLSWRAENNSTLRVSAWRQNASDEFVLVDGNAQNVGKTRRDGIDLSASVPINDQFYLWANYTTVDSEILLPASSLNAAIGNELRSVPDRTGSLGLSFIPNETIQLRMHVDHQGDYYVNELNLGGQFGDYTLLGATLDYRLPFDSLDSKLSLQMNNLTDEFYEYVFDFSTNGTDTIHSPGDGRNASITWSLAF
jgi:iron complex outermembrane recepter protein